MRTTEKFFVEFASVGPDNSINPIAKYDIDDCKLSNITMPVPKDANIILFKRQVAMIADDGETKSSRPYNHLVYCIGKYYSREQIRELFPSGYSKFLSSQKYINDNPPLTSISIQSPYIKKENEKYYLDGLVLLRSESQTIWATDFLCKYGFVDENCFDEKGYYKHSSNYKNLTQNAGSESEEIKSTYQDNGYLDLE